MLENMRRQGASIFIYLIFGLLVAIFVININPGNKGGRDAGCGTTSNVVVDVDGSRANETGWHVAYGSEYTSFVARQYSASQRTESSEGRWREYVALDTLIRRELLATAAAEHGIRVNGEMLDEEIKKGFFFLHAPPALQPAQDYPIEPTGRVQLGGQIFDFHHSEACSKADAPAGCNEQCNPQLPFGTCKPGFTCIAGEEEGQGTCDKECTPKGNECGTDERCVMGRCSTWSVAKWKRFASNSHDNISLNAFREEQMRSLAATLMAEYLVNSVRASRDEALADFLYEGNTVAYDVVSFNPKDYERLIKLTDADLQRFLTTHDEDVKKKYKAEEVTYKKTKPALKLRKLFIAKAEPPKEEPKPDAPKPDGAKPDDKKPGDKKIDATKPDDKNAAKVADAKPADAKKADAKPADAKKADAAGAKAADAKKPDAPKPPDAKKPADDKAPAVGMPLEQGKAKLEAARAAIASGKQKFADAVRELSTEDGAKLNGGDVGWKQIESPELGETAINDAIKALKPGEMTPVVAGERGVYLVMAEDKREGDLSYDQVKLEIAADLAKVEWSKERAKRDALEALENAKKSGKKLSDLFEKEDLGKPIRGPQDIKIPQQGALKIETIDIPVAWKAEDKDGSSSGSATEAPAGSAAGAPAAPTAGSGSAAPAPAPAPAKPAGPAPIVATTDQLPNFGTYKPRLQTEPPTPREEFLPMLGKDLTKVVFDEMSAGDFAKRVYDVDNAYVVFQVTAKGQPKVEDFDKDADKQVALLRLKRSHIVVEEFLKSRCEALTKENKIKALQHVREQETEGKPVETYRPCMTSPFWLLRFR